MRKQPFFRLLEPLGAALARQLSHPSGWFGRTVTRRVGRVESLTWGGSAGPRSAHDRP